MPCTASVGYPARVCAARSAAGSSSSGAVSSETRPISYARCAESRSAVPIRDIRAASPKGIRCAMYTASYALTIPYVVCGSKYVAVEEETMNSDSPSR